VPLVEYGLWDTCLVKSPLYINKGWKVLTQTVITSNTEWQILNQLYLRTQHLSQKHMNTYQYQLDNQVILICDIETVVFCNIITSTASIKLEAQ